MKRSLILFAVIALGVQANAQDATRKYLSFAVFTTQNAMPFGRFAGLFDETLHPGVEAGYGKNISSKAKHAWFMEFKAACFYHRFVQLGIPVYLNLGYRYKIGKGISAETSFGAGYMHSIATTAKFKLNADGEYVASGGIGRMQATVSFGLGIGYTLNSSAARPVRVFASYQQRLQMPFVKSYVPLLPYNSFLIGVSRSIK
jgi:hypothetical protein